LRETIGKMKKWPSRPIRGLIVTVAEGLLRA